MTPRAAGGPDPRPWLLVLAAGLFAVGAAGALLQPPGPPGFAAGTALETFFEPIEVNRDQRLLATNANLRAVFALENGSAVWAVGDRGALLESDDGGAHWRRGVIVDAAPPSKLPTGGEKGAWLERLSPIGNAAAAQKSPPLETLDPSQVSNAAARPAPNAAPNASSSAPPPGNEPPADARQSTDSTPREPYVPPTVEPPPSKEPDLRAVWFVDASTGWAVGRGGAILASVDGGATWAFQASGTRADLAAVRFTNARSGWAVGSYGVVMRTTDGGRSWTLDNAGSEDLVATGVFASSATAWAVDAQGSLWVYDGSASWTSRFTGNAPAVRSAVFLSPGSGYAISGDLLLRHSGGGSRLEGQDPWPPFYRATWKDLRGLTSDAAGNVWMLGQDGLLIRANAPQADERPTGTAVGAPRAVHFSGSRGWIVGDGGLVMTSPDGGLHWESQTRGIREKNGAIALIDPRTGEKLRTVRGADAGPAYLRLPAPWCWFAWVVSLLIVVFAARMRAPARGGAAESSIEDLLAPDRPLRPGDPDPLGAGSIARALSRFLRNPRTEPSLTLAITGEWGTGKSSVMNLLRGDLQTFSFYPVWFNAWHHQKGEQLLASLFANLRAQAIPGVFTLTGIEFYARLAMHRFRRRWIVSGLVLTCLALSWGFLASNADVLFPGGFDSLEKGISAVLTLDFDALRGTDLARLLPIGGATLPLLILFRILRAFGLSVGSLMTEAGQSLKTAQVEAQPSARYRFAQEFDEVTQALGDRRLVIFIDDLDRCDQDHVIEVLEMVNFLACSGSCFIVMGLARRWVETCIGLNYQQLAAEGEVEVTDAESRRKFARNYLEKLINIEVPVPVPADMADRLLSADPHAAAGADQGLRWERLPVWSRAAIAGVALVAFLFTAAHFGARWKVHARHPAEVAAVPAGPDYAACLAQALAARFGPDADANATVDWNCVSRFLVRSQGLPAGGADAAAGAKKGARAVSTPEESKAPPLQVVEGQAASTSFGWVTPMGGLAALAVLLAILWWRRPDPRAQDSATFRQALVNWKGVIALAHPTPRAVKRFLNRVRYLAMRFRDGSGTPAGAHGFDEAALVGIAALHALDPALADHPLTAGAEVATRWSGRVEDAAIRKVQAIVDAAVAAHQRAFPQSALADGDLRDGFLAAAGEVTLN